MDQGDEILLRVWDEDMMGSDAIGLVKFKLSSLMIDGGVEDAFEIHWEDRPAGRITLKSEFEPVGGDKYENLKEEYAE